MGRMIACKEHIGGQRIWNLDEFEPTKFDVCMMIQNVEGVHIDGSHCNYNMLTNMDLENIRLLHIKNCKIVDYFYKSMMHASKLRWMRISMSFQENEGEEIKELQPSFFIPFKQLRVLEMKYFRHLQHLPSEIDTLDMLEHLSLNDWRHLKFLPKTLGNLTSLVTLDLSRCSELKELPETLGNLTSLVTLSLRYCKNLKELPETLGNLTSLVTLHLSFCSELKELPETLGNLTSLVTLNLRYCKNLKELPETLGNLTSAIKKSTKIDFLIDSFFSR